MLESQTAPGFEGLDSVYYGRSLFTMYGPIRHFPQILVIVENYRQKVRGEDRLGRELDPPGLPRELYYITLAVGMCFVLFFFFLFLLQINDMKK